MKFEGLTCSSKVLEFLSGNGFHSLGHCDLDLLTTKSIGVFYLIRDTTL